MQHEIKTVLRRATIDLKIIPVLCGSSFKNKGVQKLLDCSCRFSSSPIDSKEIEAHHIGLNDFVKRKIE